MMILLAEIIRRLHSELEHVMHMAFEGLGERLVCLESGEHLKVFPEAHHERSKM
jgi:hypothetical protein